MDWPPYSPDLNPIENLWWEIKHLVNVIDPTLQYTTGNSEAIRQRFSSAIQRAWASIPPARIRGLVKSMDDRVNAVLEAKGWYTRY
jgi:hypothetical protein